MTLALSAVPCAEQHWGLVGKSSVSGRPAEWVLIVAAAGNAWPRSCDHLVRARPDDGTAKGKHSEVMPSQINVLPCLGVGN